MLIGAGLIIFVHAIFSMPILNYWFVAVILIIILGVALSLVPSAMCVIGWFVCLFGGYSFGMVFLLFAGVFFGLAVRHGLG